MKHATSIEQFVDYKPGSGHVLSIYLNVDQSNSANLNRGFETALDARLRALESNLEEASEFNELLWCADIARKYIASFEPNSAGLVIFSQANGSISARQLDVPVENIVRWQDHPYIQPLLEATDEFEEILIVLVDHSRARVLTDFLGCASEVAARENSNRERHKKTAGTDHIMSQAAFQRRADEHLKSYLKSVAEAVDTATRSRSIEKIVIAGDRVASKELRGLLAKDVRNRVVSFLTLAITDWDNIDEAVAGTRYRAERQQEEVKVNSLLERAGHRAKAVVGPGSTFGALAAHRVHEFIYADGLAVFGGHCEECHAVVADETICPYCESALKPVEDILELAIGDALEKGATVKQVRGKAAEKLKAAGGMGAFLRF